MKILIWGTGYIADGFVLTSGINKEEILGYVESKKSKEIHRGTVVYSPEEIKSLDYDIIIVASSYVEEIKEEIERQGIDSDKVVFLFLSKIGILDDKDCSGSEKHDFFAKYNSDIWISYLRALYSNSRKLIEQITTNTDMTQYWKEQETFKSAFGVSDISNRQQKLLEKYFLPHLKKDQTICDFACASGEWSEFMSPYVGHIDGFDCSEKMLAYAAENADSKGISNIVYKYMDATRLKFERKYDHFIMFGLFTYIDDEHMVEHIIRSVADSLEEGGYLAVRDTLNMSEPGNIYYSEFNSSNYIAVYHQKEVYEKIFERNGFEILHHEYFLSYYHEPIEVGSHGYILRKK